MRSIALRGAVMVAALAMLTTMWPTDALAQRRAAVRVAPRRAVVIGGYYRPLFYSPLYDPFFYDPWYGPWYRPYGPYPPYAYQPGYAEASVRLQVSPRETEVFVDGSYAGTVDEFDGVFQRLHLNPGQHQIQLYLAGHRPIVQNVYLQVGKTFNIRESMEPLGPGEAEAPRPVPPEPPAARRGPDRDPRVPPGRQPRQPPVQRGARADFGAITFHVQPVDAEVLIDSERWQGPRADEALVVQVSPGSHHIEIRKDGYAPFTTDMEVASGESLPLNVSLPRQ